jgi:hypothetical protein
MDQILLSSQLTNKLVRFVQDIKESTRHSAVLGNGMGIDETAIYNDSFALLQEIDAEQNAEKNKNKVVDESEEESYY